MKTQTPLNLLSASLLLIACSSIGAQEVQPQDFPNEKDKPKTCKDFQWNADMIREHPRVIDACQEAVVAGESTWARLSARFVRVQRDGGVTFEIRDSRDQTVDKVTLNPAPDQVAFINDQPTPFNRLRTTDSVSLYVPEGQYGYATVLGAPREQLATYRQPLPEDEMDSSAVLTDDSQMPDDNQEPAAMESAPVAMTQRQPTMLPSTAGTTPWLALGGGLCLMAAFSVTLLRKR